MMNYNHLVDIPIHKAALLGDWDSANEIFQLDPNLMTKQITYQSETPLIIAIGTNRSNRFVKKLVKSIADKGDAEKLLMKSYQGNNPLHYAAKVGNTTAARILVGHFPDMTRTLNDLGDTPLILAAFHGHKETLVYLLTVTPDLPIEEGISPYTGVSGGDLITLTLKAGFYDVASDIICKHPQVMLERDRNNETALQILALKPKISPGGSTLAFWGRFIYSLIPMKKSRGAFQVKKWNLDMFIAGFWSAFYYLAPTIKNIHDMKVNDNASSSLVKGICEAVIINDDHYIAWNNFGTAIIAGVTYGAHELVEECIVTYPSIIWYTGYGFNLLTDAIKHRQERVYNLVYRISGHKAFPTTINDEKENILHLAAKLAPPHRLDVVTGAALQLQRELQWFQEVNKFAEPSLKEALNKSNETPKMVFKRTHEKLYADGEQWMKNIASSSTVVAAFIVTMAFAAAFTVPGGNQEDGKPLFVNKNTFMLFIVSDAVALFSATASVLMFLGVLTSGFDDNDFLHTLPKTLMMGLLFLFISIAATLIAFSSALSLVLENKVTWIATPLVIATSIPVYLFGSLQFPLLVELVISAYGRGIFHQQNARKIR